MSIRLYQGASGSNGYLAPSTLYPGIQYPGGSAPPWYAEFKNISLSSGFCVQIAAKLFSINNGSYIAPGGSSVTVGTRSQLFSIPSSMATVGETQYPQFECFGIYVGSDGSLHVQLNSASGPLDYGSAAGVITTGTWYRICVNLTPSGVLTASVNGAQVLSQAVTVSGLSNIPFVAPLIGVGPLSSVSPWTNTFHLDAEIDSVWIWFGSLSSSDISSLASGHSPLRVSMFPSIGIPFGLPTSFAQSGTQSCYNSQVLSASVYAPEGVGLPPIFTVDLAQFNNINPGVTSPSFVPTHRGRQRFAFPLIRQFGTAASSARFSDLAASHLVQVLSVSASDLARFTGLGSEKAKHAKSLSDSAYFTASAMGGVHAYKQLPSAIATFHDMAAASVHRLHGGPSSDSASFHDLASVVDIGHKAVSVSAGARFFDRAAAGGKWHVSATDTAKFYDELTIRGHVSFAADSARFHDSATSKSGVRVSDSASFHDVAFGGAPSNLSVFDSAKFTDAASARQPQKFVHHVSDSFYFVFTLATVHDTSVFVAASDVAFFSDDAGRGGVFGYAVDASDSAYVVAETVQAAFRRAYGELPPTAKGRFSDRASATVLRIRKASASDSFRFTDSTSVGAASLESGMAVDGGRFTDLALEFRITTESPADSAKFVGTAAASSKHAKSASDSASFTGLASETTNKLGAKGLISASDRADASVLLPGGSVVPGGDQALGLRQILWPTLSTEFPLSFTESAEGYLFAATGVDPVIAWDGSSATAWQAGIQAPDSVVWLGRSGSGSLMGRRWAYLRYVDSRGNVSNLSQVSDPIDLGGDGFVEAVAYSDATVSVRSRNHGLVTGSTVAISGVAGLSMVNGQWTIAVVDPDTFTLNGLVISGGTYGGGGIWSNGASQVIYSNVEIPQDPKIARRQILRNLAGDASVFYVDVDTTNLTSTSFSSTSTDEQLATNLSVPILFQGDPDDQGGVPAANRFGQPPSWKCALASYSGRVWAAADRIYNTGNVSVTFGSPYVVGIGTLWTPALAGRLLYVPGSQPQPILSVTGQILTLETPYNGPSQVFAFYSIRPAPVERLLVYYSEPHTPEAWPPWNAFSVPETSDEITGLFVLKSFLYIAKERNIYKFAFKEDPGRDGYAFPTANRGCINNRCYVLVESDCYLLDEAGIYSFDGDGTEPISESIQVLFKSDDDSLYRVDWTTDRTFWHAVHDPSRETIRWFVDLVGQPSLSYSICYDYRRKFWWLEQYPEAITSSALCVVSNQRQPAVGTSLRRVLCVGQGTTDLIPESAGGTLRGTSTGADTLSLSDATASFPSNLAGVPVTLVSGTGAGQQAIISSNTSTTLVPVDPWQIIPDTTTVYQIGGISWSWKSGWRRISDDESENPRDLEFVFKPTKNPSTFDASLYYDHSDTPEAWGYDIDRDGISISMGDTSMVIDMVTPRGYAIQRMSSHRDPYGYGHRFLALELNGVQGVDPQRIYSLVINGVE